MSKADAGLLVVRAGKTRYSVVDKLLEQMPKEKLLGVVLNRTQEQPDESPTTTSTVTTTANARRLKFRRTKTRRGGSDRQLRVLRLNGRTILLIIAEASDLRRDDRCRVPARGLADAPDELVTRNGYMKAAVACLLPGGFLSFRFVRLSGHARPARAGAPPDPGTGPGMDRTRLLLHVYPD